MHPRIVRPAIRALPGTLLAVLLLPASPAQAHIDLDSPTDRGCTDQKTGPCGSGCDARSSNVTVLPPGATITVQWTETVNHPGHYRISFDDDGIDDFQPPTSQDDIQTNPVLPVLLDGIADKNGGAYEAQVTLPNIECENCTLQLIQFMFDKPLSNAFYYRCADLALRQGAPAPVDAGPGGGGVDAGPGGGDSDAGPGGGGGGGGGGCSASGGDSLGLGLLLLAAALLLRRRHARQPQRVSTRDRR